MDPSRQRPVFSPVSHSYSFLINISFIFIYLTNIYRVPGMVLDARDLAVNKTQPSPHFPSWSSYSTGGGRGNSEQILKRDALCSWRWPGLQSGPWWAGWDLPGPLCWLPFLVEGKQRQRQGEEEQRRGRQGSAGLDTRAGRRAQGSREWHVCSGASWPRGVQACHRSNL